MIDLSFKFRESTQDEILLFSEEYSNVYRLNSEVKFTTAILQNENYAIFGTKEENNKIRVLFFLILEHPLRFEINLYVLFCAFIKEMTRVEPLKENVGKSKRICWNLQDRRNHMYFEEVIFTKGGDTPTNTPEFYKDGYLVRYNYKYKAWKENVNHVDRYYFEQTLDYYEEEEKTPEWYSDYEYAIWFHACDEDLDEMCFYLLSRNYDRETKKVIPFSKNILNTINITCKNIQSTCFEYESGSPILTEFLEQKLNRLKDSAEEYYEKVCQIEDLNEPYFAETKANLARTFRLIRGLKLPAKEK